MKKFIKIFALMLGVLWIVSGCNNHNTPTKILVEANVYTFSDGESVSTWKFQNDSKLRYLLSDGTELMATKVVGPEHNIHHDAEPLESLKSNVQDSIVAFYEEQGALYDVEEYLEKVYSEYIMQKDRLQFRCYYITQESFVSASDEKMVYCTTSVSLPLSQGEYESYSVTKAFDKVTGSVINN